MDMALHSRDAVTVSVAVATRSHADCSSMEDHTSLSTALVYLLGLTVVQNCHTLQKSTQSRPYAGGGQWPPNAFLNVDYDSLHFHTGSLKINIFEILMGGCHKKSTSLCTLLIMLTIMDDPLYPKITSNKNWRIFFQDSPKVGGGMARVLPGYATTQADIV